MPVGAAGAAPSPEGADPVDRSVAATARELVVCSHPLPTVAVTAISAGLAVLAGNSAGRSTLVTAAVFTGQLSIGWSNDRIDSARDRDADRTDKPLAVAAVSPAVVTSALVVAVLATVPLSLALGYRAGGAALTGALCGWLYNLGLKATIWSWAPYAVAFGALPAIATLALPTHPWPAAWALASGALLGVAAHLANTLPDLAADAVAGIRGLPHRLGANVTAATGAALLLGATAVIVVGSSTGPVSGPRWATFAVVALLAVVAEELGRRRPTSQAFFLVTVLVAGADVVLFALAGGTLY
jgi:4-hydroxybenzoate polyprenyltransferase